MKNFKQLTLFFFSLFIATIIYYHSKNSEIKKNNFYAYKKNESSEISRIPASVDSPKNNQVKKLRHDNLPVFKMRNGRVLAGENAGDFLDPSIDLPMINKINPNWTELLKTDLLRFQGANTEVLIHSEEPYILISEGKGRFVEKVSITYKFKNGDKNSFRAYVDSEYGLILETWDRTLHERFKRRPTSLFPVPLEGAIVK
jgi:hypothetical protein